MHWFIIIKSHEKVMAPLTIFIIFISFINHCVCVIISFILIYQITNGHSNISVVK